MFNYFRIFFLISDNVLRLNNEFAIKRFSNFMIAVDDFLKYSLISAGPAAQLCLHLRAAVCREGMRRWVRGPLQMGISSEIQGWF